ncbi:MAG: YihY/virulence factor BrkB family protein [Ruminococcaceae bacterium]|nr:YihY/virulence factor BrkB family protein [Oscillospiraceae bacterium]
MKIPKGGLIGHIWSYLDQVRQMQIGLYAAHAGYFIVLSVFPTLVLLLGLLRYTGMDAGDLLSLLSGVVPDALLPAAERLIISAYAYTSRTVVSISAIGVLWSASRGIYGLLMGLNAIYGVQENRGYFYTRAISVLYTFLFLLVLILTLVLNVFGSSILEMLPPLEGAFWVFWLEIIDLRFVLLLLLQTALFTAMFMALPNRKNKFSDSFPGAVFTSAGWFLFSKLFSTYVEYFSSYSSIYGSVYMVALSMLWLYFCLWILFCGGALNRFLMKK